VNESIYLGRWSEYAKAADGSNLDAIVGIIKGVLLISVVDTQVEQEIS